jgi:hypothetical protein
VLFKAMLLPKDPYFLYQINHDKEIIIFQNLPIVMQQPDKAQDLTFYPLHFLLYLLQSFVKIFIIEFWHVEEFDQK